MNLGLNEKVVIITGASKGIGKAIAEDFAKEGAKIALCGRYIDKLNIVKNDILGNEGKICCFSVEGTNYEQVCNTVESINKHFGQIDILVNTIGGIYNLKPFLEITNEEWNNMLNLNLNSAYFFTKSAINFLKKSLSPRIINIASLSGKEPGINMAHYNLSKSAIINFTKSLSREFASYGILVNSVSPGITLTDMWNNLSYDLSQKLGISQEDITKLFCYTSIPLGRIARPEEISPMVVFLASQKASYITGTNICIDGGAGNCIN